VPPPDDSPDTRERLVQAAMELFVLQGYGSTGLAQIARSAGARPGSLYWFFPTKEALLAATLERRKELLWPDVLEPIWSGVDDPLERVFALLDGYRRMLELTDFAHGCPIGNLALELAESHPRTRSLLAENFDNWLDAVERCFADARDRLPDDVEPRRLAIFVLTTMEGAVMLGRTYRSFDAYDAAVTSLREYVDLLVARATSWGPEDAAREQTRRERA